MPPSPRSIDDVFEKLRAIAHTSGERRSRAQECTTWPICSRQVDSVSAKYLVRMLARQPAHGYRRCDGARCAGQGQVERCQKRKLLEVAYHKVSDLGLIARTLWEHPGEEEAQRVIAAMDVQVGKPVQSQLAERLPTA